MELKILGTGCANCRVLERQVREVLSSLHLDTRLIKVEDMTEIISYGIVHMPALVIDGELVVNGWIPRRDELERLFTLGVGES